MTDNLLQELPPTIDPNTDFLNELVGENKKFKTPQDLAKGKFESDNYIKVLETRLDEFREDYKKLDADYKSRAKVEELIDKLGTLQAPATLNQEPPVKVEKPAIDPNEIKNLVASELKEMRTQNTQEDNYNRVGKTLKEHFGDNYASDVKRQLESLDLTEDDFHNLARTRPNFLLKALGADKPLVKETFQTPPRNERRSDTFSPRGAQKRTWSYYQNMKKENPDLYRNPKTNVDMHNDMMALGEEFKDGDFGKYGD